jgi:heat shock protein HslJ
MVAPLIPLALGAIILVGCAKAAQEIRRAQPLPSLEGSEWRPADSAQFVAFKTGGEIAGNAGCNNFFGQYEQDGESLKIGALASTKKMCAGKMEAEAAFLKDLQDARRAVGTHKALTLFGADGEVLMELRRSDWD